MLNCLEGYEIRKTLSVHIALSLLQNHPFSFAEKAGKKQTLHQFPLSLFKYHLFSPFTVWVCFHYSLCNTYRGRLLDIGNQVNGQQQSFPESQQTITVVTWLHTSYWMEKWSWQITWHFLLAGPWMNCSFQVCDFSLAKSSEIKVKVTHDWKLNVQ